MKKIILLVIILSSSFVLAQTYTSLTVTLTDNTGQVWSNATVTAVIRPPFGNPNALKNNGVDPVSPQTIISDGTGTFHLSLDDNLAMFPSGSTWTFTICPNATVQTCSVTSQVVTGATQNLSSNITPSLTPVAIQAAPFAARAYQDSQVNISQGGLYWNVTNNTLRGYDGTMFVPIGSGGGGGISRWDQLLSPTQALPLAMNGFPTVFTLGNTQSTGAAFDITDNINNPGTNYLFRAYSQAGSAASPFDICARGLNDCVMFTPAAMLMALGNAEIIANEVISNQTGIGSVTLGSNGFGSNAPANTVKITGNNNKLYASENNGALSKVLLGGGLTCASPFAFQSVDLDGILTCVRTNGYDASVGTSHTWTARVNFEIGGTHATYNPSVPILAQRIKAYSMQAPAGCSVQPIVNVNNGSVSSTLSLANGATVNDSGSISQVFGAGAAINISPTFGTGCSTIPGPTIVEVNYTTAF